MAENPAPIEGPGYDKGLAVNVLEAQLTGEAEFLDRVTMLIRRHLGLPSESPLERDRFPSLTSKTGHDNLVHLAQFFFLLDALACTTPEQIAAFIDAHNEKIEGELAGNEATASRSELKRAIFKSARKSQVYDTFKFYGRPVFAISEIGHLAFDLMSPATTTNLITELLDGGVFHEPVKSGHDAPITTDPRRVLVEPVPAFVAAYGQSLITTRSIVLRGGG